MEILRLGAGAFPALWSAIRSAELTGEGNLVKGIPLVFLTEPAPSIPPASSVGFILLRARCSVLILRPSRPVVKFALLLSKARRSDLTFFFSSLWEPRTYTDHCTNPLAVGSTYGASWV